MGSETLPRGSPSTTLYCLQPHVRVHFGRPRGPRHTTQHTRPPQATPITVRSCRLRSTSKPVNTVCVRSVHNHAIVVYMYPLSCQLARCPPTRHRQLFIRSPTSACATCACSVGGDTCGGHGLEERAALRGVGRREGERLCSVPAARTAAQDARGTRAHEHAQHEARGAVGP